MKGRTILLGRHAGREAAALLADGQLDDLLIEAPGHRALPGAIYRAVADRPAKGQGGMFLRLPDGSAFLRQTKGISPGQKLLVQVTGFAEAGKAVPVTTRLLFKGRHAIVTPDAPGLNVSRRIKDGETRARLLDLADTAELPEGAGLILRSGAAEAPEGEISADIEQMASMAATVLQDVAGEPELLLEGPGPHELACRDWGMAEVREGADAFAAHGVPEMVAELLSPAVRLSGGGSMSVEPTRAMVAVDVNTGGDTSPAAGLKANIAAARALPRQLRCRGLGGQVVIDFAPMPRRDRVRLEQSLVAAFRADPVETALAGWTPLSHMELQRKRERLPLSELLAETRPA